MHMLRAFFRNLWELVIGTFTLLIALVWFFIIMRALNEASPFITLIFVLGGTAAAMDGNWLRKSECIAGWTLYISGWLIVPYYGPIAGAWVCGAGIIVWFLALIGSFADPFTPRPVHA